jgi:2-polyprenyl-3-methyl-5-hydroxy-6-metoxy-1,4-benzoquinol methylase
MGPKTAVNEKIQGYYDQKSAVYARSLNKAILEFFSGLPPLTILDVGCADGELGAELKGWGHKVFGLEISPLLAEQARRKLNGVMTGNVEDVIILEGFPEQFDAIIFGDVLEHTFHPKSVLERMKARLSDVGFFVISVPNIGYFKARLRFLFDTVEYEPTGTFDDGHIRMFNERILTRMASEVGMKIIEWRSTYLPLVEYIRFLRGRKDLWLYRTLVEIERPLRSLFRRIAYPQFVVKAVKA